MFAALREWLEGLFRPVFRVNADSSVYIARTPTVLDVELLKNIKVLREAWTTGIVADHQTQTWTVPPGKRYIVRSVSSAGTTALNPGAFLLYLNREQSGFYPYGGRSHSVSAAGVSTPQVWGFYGEPGLPLILNPGDSVYLYSYNNPVGTYNFMIYYNEVMI